MSDILYLMAIISSITVKSDRIHSNSTHTPLARRDLIRCCKFGQIAISTHTPLARRDLENVNGFSLTLISTHTPLARRDELADFQNIFKSISTHTPLARRDIHEKSYEAAPHNFYSHASCEARRQAFCKRCRN